MYKEIDFILFNNRSKNFVLNFIPKDLDLKLILDIEDRLKWVKRNITNRNIIVQKDKLDLTQKDIILSQTDISNLKEIVNNSSLNEIELDFLHNRGITDNIIQKWNIRGISNIPNEYLDTIGWHPHPIMIDALNYEDDKLGIIIPFQNNYILRRINTTAKLKYNLTIPDIDIFGNLVDGCFIVEGVFDMIWMGELGHNTITCSSPTLSSLQIYKLIKSGIKNINILFDNDVVGIRSSYVLKRVLGYYGIDAKTFITDGFKDPDEMVRGGSFNLKEIEITLDMVKDLKGDFDYLKYLNDRIF